MEQRPLFAHRIKRGAIQLFSIGIFVNIVSCSSQAIEKKDKQVVQDDGLPPVSFCSVPDPQKPSSAFHFYKSESEGKSGYWVRYECKKACDDWRQCLVPAHARDDGELLFNARHPQQAKQALAFVVDGMAGHLAVSSDGEKTVFIHTGAGGTRYYAKPAATLEQNSSAHTVMIRWEKGYTSPIVQPPFTQPISWGWFSRTSEQATDIKELNKRVASIMAWTHEHLSNGAMFGTLGCSMGTNATFGPVLWHGLDPIIDYQLFVGGPNMWDLNAQCNRRQYRWGFCDIDGETACSNDSDCIKLGEQANCAVPHEYTTIDLLFEQLPNHIHVTDACDIRASDENSPPYADFNKSSMGFAAGADWSVEHPLDFLVNLGAKQGATRQLGLGGDEYWALGHFPPVYNKIKPDSNKQWQAIPDSHHCDAMFEESLELIKERMGL